MNGILGAETGEVVLPPMFLEEMSIEWIDLVELELIGVGHPCPDLGHLHLRGPEVVGEKVHFFGGSVGHR